MISKKWLLPLLAAILLAVLGITLTSKEKAPNVRFTTLSGQEMTLDALKGKVVLVNFWATDCPGCVAEMPEMIHTYQQYRDKGFEVVAVAMPYDPIDQVKNYTEKNALPFTVTHDSTGEISNRFDQVRVTPTAFILDKDGRIIRKSIGELDFNSLHALLDSQLSIKG